MRTLILHLETATQRRANVELLLRKLENASIFPASSPITMEERRYVKQLSSPIYPFDLRPAEIAIFDSYRRIWSAIASGDDKQVLVVEDDVSVDLDQFEDALKLARENTGVEDYVRFPFKRRGRNKTHTPMLKKPKKLGLGTQAQLIGRNAAKRLLEATETFDRPIDTSLQMTWVTGQQIFEIEPSGISEISSTIGGSTIQGNGTGGTNKLRREVLRASYRLKLLLLSQIKT